MKLALTALALVLAVPVLAAPSAPRPAADVARDAARKPTEMMRFAQVKPGQTVAELIPGGGYFTRVLAEAVGPNGTVLAMVPASSLKKHPNFKTDAEAVAAAYPNVKVMIQSLGTIAAPGTVDLVWTAQNYHDLHNAPPGSVDGVNKSAFTALKPGGLYVVVDHSAAAGSGARDTNTLHRIDEATVKAGVTAAGFVLDGDSQALRNPADPRTAIVFDPAIRGHTDQFALRFRKPK